MSQYNNEILAEMCSKVDLLDYVSRFHEIKKIANNYYIKCPIHNGDNNPSMIINPNTNKYYCFGCGATGSILDWFTKIEHLSWNDALDKLTKMSGMKNVHLKQCEILSFFKMIKKISVNTKEKISHIILPSDIMNNFSDEIPTEWIEEGITEDAIKEYEIKIDNRANRIIYPVYDNDLNLIGVKGRTRFPQYKELGIQKYMNYYKIGTADFFMGMKQNREEILKTSSVIIFEGIKSPMKMSGWGYHNTLAAETSCLNEEQVIILIKMGIKDVTIAFDEGIAMDKILKCTEQLRRFTNVYVVKNRNNLLEDKDAPVDKGKDVWDKLFSEREKIS